MKSKKVMKCAIRSGGQIHVGYLTPPDKEGARWTGRCNGVTAVADTAEECADKLGPGA